jgi:hypothetical protein
MHADTAFSVWPSPRQQNIHSRGHASRRRRRDRLIAAAIEKHGPAGLSLLLESLEIESGDDLHIDARLEFLTESDPRAIALFEAAVEGGAKPLSQRRARARP